MSGIKIEKIGDNTVVFKLANGSLNVTIKQGDLSTEICDAIVNPTKKTMAPDGGLDAVIHSSMGKFFSDQVAAVSEELKEDACPIGQSRIFVARNRQNLKVARFVINTVGPQYTPEEKDNATFLLQSCYCSVFGLANAYSLTSIAFPAISCGAFRYPPNEAAQVSIESIRQHAYNVKDVRFILFDKMIYDAFVNEWTQYAEKVNVAAVSTDLRSRLIISAKPSKESLNSYRCVLCDEKSPLSSNKELCTKCSQLTRSQLFDTFLQRLREAAATSFQDVKNTCELLKPILNKYPLTYAPLRKFDQAIHKRDNVAEHYLQVHCDHKFRQSMPMAVLGDGNCFYNTFVRLAGAGTTIEESSMTPVELRARNIVELVIHINKYKKDYKSIVDIFDEFEKYVIEEMVHDTNYAALWDLLSIPTVLNIDVIIIYPKVNGVDDIYYQTLNDKTFKPMISSTTSSTAKSTVMAPNDERVVKLLFSHCNIPVVKGVKKENWTPNHFVPLLSLR